MPFGAMPLGSDPTSSGDGKKSKKQKIPEKPTEAKPKPPVAPWMARGASKAEEDRNQSPSQTTKETSSESVVSQVPAGQTQESLRYPEDGGRIMGFGRYPGASYNEAWGWICEGKIDLDGLLQRCGVMDGQVLKFTTWAHRKQQGM